MVTDTAAVVNLYEMVRVARVEGGDRFVGDLVSGPFGRIFGGQLIGQAVTAATATTTLYSERHAHSLHAYFLRKGDASRPVTYEVDSVRDGRSFSVRSVRAFQDDRVLLTATMSFHEAHAGLTHQVDRGGYPDPDSLPPDKRLLDVPTDSPHPGHRSAVEIRRIPPALYPTAQGSPPGQAVWIRSRTQMGAHSHSLVPAVLALSTDFTVLESIVYGHGLTFATPGLSIASLDHAVWWHAHGNMEDWLLYIQSSPWAGGERGLVTGRIYDRGGKLLASVAQEGLIRLETTRAAK
ncbi:acyl-CoA thioesterase II [Cryobacterium sp. Y62]|uniref:acyl-CoA thioesterase n=1 Tax=Cryobacterium sp. Y62 TaxID=2048284 RepID=UPI001E3CB1FD|nr:acyl-CoA thioesterase domain-containing protein [Cryobacterium sp. Y62]